MKVDIGISEKNRNDIAVLLNKLLAHQFSLHTKNVKLSLESRRS